MTGALDSQQGQLVQQPQPRPLDVVILAAGQGTRMRSRLSKLLHPVLGRPMVGWSVRAAQGLGARDIVVVTGHEAEQVEAALSASGVRFVRQAQRLGTGHAFLTAARTLQGGADILLLYGDSPMLRLDTLRAMVEAHRREHTNLSILTSELDDATGYGRIIRGPDGGVQRIVEEKAATPAERQVREFNSGVYVMDPQAPHLAEHIGHDNPAGEYYITDLVSLYSREGARVVAFFTPDAGEVMGANDRAQLAVLEATMRRRVNERHMLAGVSLVDPATTVIEDTVDIAPDVTLEPGVILRGQTVLKEGVTVGAYSVVTDSRLEPGVTVKPHSVLEGARVGAGSDVGPFARLRPGTVLGEGVHIGNFVETKNARLEGGVKAGHLAYLGDVEIGQETNIGAGTIVANFDGLNKHASRIGAGAFIGSNSTIIAPRVLGDAAFVAAGSTIAEDVPEGALSVARGRQRTVGGWSERYWRGLGERVAERLPWLGGWLRRQEQGRQDAGPQAVEQQEVGR